jgi:hypothetical protein
MRRSQLLSLIALIVTPLALQASAGQDTTDSRLPGPTLDAIKGMVGDWVAVGEDGQLGTELVSTSRITAGGSAVIETVFPGPEREMVTVYYMDGDDLVLTHYCVAGNQPHMRARRDSPQGSVVFECLGGANIVTAEDAHMHSAIIQIEDADHVHSVWSMFEGTENTYTADFRLVRKPRDGAR